jgi:hypothetical protein
MGEILCSTIPVHEINTSTGDAFYGSEASLAPYAAYQKSTGSQVTTYRLPTITSEDLRRLIALGHVPEAVTPRSLPTLSPFADGEAWFSN